MLLLISVSAKQNARVVETLITVSHDIKIYALHEKDEDICLVQSPIGAAASAQVLDTLVSCGCKKIIAVGSCGVLADIEENAFIVPCKALRAEGASYHYLPASRYIELDEEPISIMRETFTKHGLPFVTCATWSTDGFFRETEALSAEQPGCAETRDCPWQMLIHPIIASRRAAKSSPFFSSRAMGAL